MELKKLGDFDSVNIFTWEVAGAEETHEGACEAQTRPSGTGPSLGRATQARSLVERRLASVFLCTTLSRTKTSAIFFLEFF
jgi:hypothetical protein